MALIKTKIGTDDFLEVYNEVRNDVLANRHARRQERSIMVCRVFCVYLHHLCVGGSGSRSPRKEEAATECIKKGAQKTQEWHVFPAKGSDKYVKQEEKV